MTQAAPVLDLYSEPAYGAEAFHWWWRHHHHERLLYFSVLGAQRLGDGHVGHRFVLSLTEGLERNEHQPRAGAVDEAVD
ncbi:hypothetical protein D3C81_1340110 [compost metagenome]